MTDRDDLDMLAAEFVLGTLDARERALWPCVGKANRISTR